MGYAYYGQKELEKLFGMADSQIVVALDRIERLAEHFGRTSELAGPVTDLTLARANLLEALEQVDIARDAYHANLEAPGGRHSS